MTIQELIDALNETPESVRHLPIYAYDPETDQHVGLWSPTPYDLAGPISEHNRLSMTLRKGHML